MSPLFKSRLLATQSDDRLVALVRSGHEAAFEALVHRYRRPLLRYCRRLCPGDARAEEALQQALTNAWIALRRGSEVRDARAWLYRVAHNAAIDAIRWERPLPAETLASGDLARDAAGVGRPSLDEAIAARDALAGMAALPLMQREVMVRTAVAGHSHEEVASALGISDGAVRGLLYRARATLRAGFTAITPAPVLAWAADAGGAGGAGGQRIAELASGGGTAGLAGLMAKGGAVAVTAGIAITGSMLVHHEASPRHRPAGGAAHRLASTAAPSLPLALSPLAVGEAGRSARMGTARDRMGGRTGPPDASGRDGRGPLGVFPGAPSQLGDGAKRGDGGSGGEASGTSGDGGSQSSSTDRSTSAGGQSFGSGGGSSGNDGSQTSTTVTATRTSSSGDGGSQEPLLESSDKGGSSLSGGGSTDGGSLESTQSSSTYTSSSDF